MEMIIIMIGQLKIGYLTFCIYLCVFTFTFTFVYTLSNCNLFGQKGTKWNINDVYCDKTDTNLSYNFSTAWSPPIQWLYKLIKIYSNLEITLKYQGDGIEFGGLIYYNGI